MGKYFSLREQGKGKLGRKLGGVEEGRAWNFGNSYCLTGSFFCSILADLSPFSFNFFSSTFLCISLILVSEYVPPSTEIIAQMRTG